MSQLTIHGQNPSQFLVALGSNAAQDIDQSVKFVSEAISRLAEISTDGIIVSRLFQSPAFPPGTGPDYVNGAVSFSSRLSPVDFLALLHQIEVAAGRVRRTRWAQRTLDLDLLAAGSLIAPDRATLTHWIDLPLARQKSEAPSELILPHPRLQDRAFVLLPLLDVAPDWRHPLIGKTVRELTEMLPESDRNAVFPLAISQPRP